MSLVDLQLLKRHVRADDFDDDDEYLAHLARTAEETVVRATRRSVEELTEKNAGEFPSALIQAMLMLAAHWYNQREAVASVQMHAVPLATATLIKPYVRLCKPDE